MNLIKYRIFRELNKKCIFNLFGYCFLLILLSLFHCAERDRTNIFDPLAGVDTLDLSLNISSADSVITLRWSAPANVEYEGFNLYRKTDNENTFSLLASIHGNLFEYNDRDVQYYQTYEYKLTVQGKDSESPATRSLKVTPGPYRFIIGDRYGFALYWVSYDLRHIFKTKYTIWMPENAAFDNIHQLFLVTYPQLGYVEVYSSIDGMTEFSSPNFQRPFDAIYIEDKNRFWITDSSGSLYSIEPFGGDTKIIDMDLIKPTQIIHGDQYIYLLDKSAARIMSYNTSGERVSIIQEIENNTLINPVYINYAHNTPFLYIIDAVDSISILYRYSRLSGEGKIFYKQKGMKIIRPDLRDNSVWIAIDQADNSSLVQLSPEGIRLKEITGFSGISDFRLNDKSNTILIADHVTKVVKHIRLSDLSVIGVFKGAIYPSKVYSE
ncbi:MAG: fibronectin type III domain-containing protein [Calditrichaceae bacterium]